jgi:hypothetical protein
MKNCSHIALMKVCKKFFIYSWRGECGLPRIDLIGTVEDWRLVRAKAEVLWQFLPDGQCSGSVGHLSVWLSVLLPALDQFVAVRGTRTWPSGAPFAISVVIHRGTLAGQSLGGSESYSHILTTTG